MQITLGYKTHKIWQLLWMDCGVKYMHKTRESVLMPTLKLTAGVGVRSTEERSFFPERLRKKSVEHREEKWGGKGLTQLECTT